MPLATSGFIAIGGTTSNRSINVELGLSPTATNGLTDAATRALAGIPSGPVVLPGDFYGKSSRSFTLTGMVNMGGVNGQFAPGNTYCYYTFYTDGDLLGFESPSGPATVNTDWTTPVTGGIGSSYWVRWTITSSFVNAPAAQVGTDGTWQQLSTARSFGLQTGNNNTLCSSYIDGYFDISSNSSGTNIVATSPLIGLFLDII